MQDQVTEEQFAQLQELLGQRRKLEAVKLYRKFTGKSLADSKAAVEAIELSEPLVSQDMSSGRSRGTELVEGQGDSEGSNVTVQKGCAAPVVLFVTVGVTFLLRCL